MILGFNTDLKRKGKTFHIQTEDSGEDHPVIITHLFLGGTILGTRRCEYSDELGRSDLATYVRDLMKRQHREMHKALTEGEFDDAIRTRRSKGPTSLPPASAPPPGALDRRAPPPMPGSRPPTPEQLGGDTFPNLSDLAAQAARIAAVPDPPEIDDDLLVFGDMRRLVDGESAITRARMSVPSEVQFPTRVVLDDRLDPVLLQFIVEALEEP